MFKKLKNKIIILNMSIISIVLLIAFSFIYMVNYLSVYDIANLKPSQSNILNHDQFNKSISSFEIIIYV